VDKRHSNGENSGSEIGIGGFWDGEREREREHTHKIARATKNCLCGQNDVIIKKIK